MKNYFKTGMFVLLGLGLTIACDDDDTTTVDNGGDGGGTTTTITEVSFTTAASGDGTEITVTPTSTGGTAYSVDFGDAAAANDADVMATAGPGVMYDYPNATATYSVSVTASATGAEDVTISQDVTVTYEAPAASDLVGEWVIAHIDGAMYLSGTVDKSGYWWASSIETIDDRDCLFDDKYIFNTDGSFENQVGDQTWINWEGGSESCDAPQTPFDGSSDMTYVHDADNNTLTLKGLGAHLGLAKVSADVLLTGPEAGPTEITYSIVSISEDKNQFEVQITYPNEGGDNGKGYWNFIFAKVGSAGAALDQTDTDGDGVIDLKDECPDVSGTEANGCPPAGTPTDSPADPSQNEADVYSLYSDYYTNSVAPSSWTQSWGVGAVEDATVGTNNMKKYSGLDFQAITLSETLDLSGYTHIHFDAWTDKENMVGIKFQDFGADDADEYPNADDSESEVIPDATQPATTWKGYDIPLSDFTGLTGTANLGQIQILLGSTSGGTKGVVYIDNVYFY